MNLRVLFGLTLLVAAGYYFWPVKKAAPPIPKVEVVAAREEVELEKVVQQEPAPEVAVDRTAEFFQLHGPKFPIVETITYHSAVPWLQGRPAWVSDYSSYYKTSRHFIARSLNGKPEYFKQDVSEGARFNVIKRDKEISFSLIVDVTRSKMWFYYLDRATGEKVLVKSYTVGVGKVEASKPSGYLTPLGTYTLGNKTAIYKPKAMGNHNGHSVEMIRIFGTRWIPFDKEVGETTAAAKGFGLHGVPWVANEKGELAEDSQSLGKHESDGCIRLATSDIEELFAIIVSRPTTISLVQDYRP